MAKGGRGLRAAVTAVSVLLSAGAVIAGAGYFFWLAPDSGPASSSPAGAVAKKNEGKGRGAAPPVTVATVVEADMPVILSAPGTVEPLATVAVKPRVDGQIVEVAFHEGDLVTAGSVMFRLDDRLVKAQIAQAEANIAKDEASLRDAQATLTRRESLIDKEIVTQAQLDQARFAVQGFQASIAAGKAMLDSQRTQLDYLTIRAPITGRTGGLAAKLGATVRTVDTTPLVTINQTRPILITFSLPQRDLPAVRRAFAAKATALVTVPGATHAPVSATISFIDNQVDKTTGAIALKVQAENTDEVLWPGQAVQVALTVEVKPHMLSAPTAAVLPAQKGLIAWVVGPDDKVMPRPVTVAGIVDQTVYLSGGLTAGERVVTDGQLRLGPGMTVRIENRQRTPAARPGPAAPAAPGNMPNENRRADGRG